MNEPLNYRREDSGKQLTVVLLADTDLLSLPLESLPMLQTGNVHCVARDFSLQMSYHRLCKMKQGEGKKKRIAPKVGLVRESNSGPLAPEARIIPLDQQANWDFRFQNTF